MMQFTSDDKMPTEEEILIDIENEQKLTIDSLKKYLSNGRVVIFTLLKTEENVEKELITI